MYLHHLKYIQLQDHSYYLSYGLRPRAKRLRHLLMRYFNVSNQISHIYTRCFCLFIENKLQRITRLKRGRGGVNVGGRTNNIINQGISLGQKCIVKIHLHTIAISTINEACFMVGLIFQLNSQKSSFYSNVWKNK